MHSLSCDNDDSTVIPDILHAALLLCYCIQANMYEVTTKWHIDVIKKVHGNKKTQAT